MTEVITRMLHAIDARDWGAVRDCFAGKVYTDYTSLWGGEPATAAIDDLIEGWQAFFAGFDATQHLTGPVVITEGKAHTHISARHWRGDDYWAIYGHYIVTVDGGVITGLTLQTYGQEGNRDLPATVMAGGAPS